MRVSSYALVAGLLILLTGAEASPGTASAGAQGMSTNHVTLVYGHPTRLAVSLYRWSTATNRSGYAVLGKGTAKDRTTITRIVDLLNQVNVPSNLPHSCPKLPGGRSVLQFGYSNGDVWTVYEGGCWDFSTHGVIGSALGDRPVYGKLPRLLRNIARVKDR